MKSLNSSKHLFQVGDPEQAIFDFIRDQLAFMDKVKFDGTFKVSVDMMIDDSKEGAKEALTLLVLNSGENVYTDGHVLLDFNKRIYTIHDKHIYLSDAEQLTLYLLCTKRLQVLDNATKQLLYRLRKRLGNDFLGALWRSL